LPLKPPPPNLSSIPLTTKTIAASNLYRVSRYTSGEPFFGRTALNRFDDRSRPKKGRFGTCYCGLDLETAVAETILHDLMPVNGRFSVPFNEFESRQLVRFSGSSLMLANLTGASLKTLVGDGALSTITPYDLPQQWAMAIHRHPQRVDGLLYMSRHLNDRQAVVVFSRAEAKLGTATYAPLMSARSIHSVIVELHISFDL
jgi:hypothetical protein